MKESKSNVKTDVNFSNDDDAKQVTVGPDPEKDTWKVYKAGPQSGQPTVICLPPMSATADVYFNQVLCLAAADYTVYAVSIPFHRMTILLIMTIVTFLQVDYPVTQTIDAWRKSFLQLLDELKLNDVWIFYQLPFDELPI